MTTTQHTTSPTVEEFFDRYRDALLARDEKAVARMYAVPALIVFPGDVIPVSSEDQTEQFFASAWGQYEGVSALDRRVSVIAESPAAVWADVTWYYDDAPRERMCYQLVPAPGGYRIAVLTPLE